MADWTYQIIDQSGKERKGNIVAESEAEAKNKLKMDGNMVISLTKATALTKEIYISSPELVTSLHRLLLGSYHTAINQLHGVRQGLFESLILRLELWHQLWELWQICAQGNRENTEFCSSIN